ncbi:MAG: hypothetical protein EOO10_13120 [Chitinophagaceae bacterium]|nr:MAG: hypothetical protein EOO10_13120 [Chitinophagaceae bacterium]
MEENSSLFSMAIEPVTKEHLSETAKWARFLAIVGFIALVLIVAVGIYTSIVLSRFEDMYGSGRRGMGNVLGIGTALTYLVVFLIYIFPIVFMYRFAGKMKQALESHDQEALNISFQNLKVCFRYLGIVTIIGIVFVAIFVFLGIASAAFF